MWYRNWYGLDVCLKRLPSASYQDRLFAAHFAVITFGLVALIGAWHDPFSSLCVAFGLSALLALICAGFSRRYTWSARGLLTSAAYPSPVREEGDACALRTLLEFIRRANLTCGAPPRLGQLNRYPEDGGSMQIHAASSPHPFLIYVFRR